MNQPPVDDFNFEGSFGSEVAKESSKGGDFARRVEFLSLKGDPASVAQGKHQGLYRFVTDFKRPDLPVDAYTLPWITAKQHYAPVKPRPAYAREGSTWPEKMSGGCRKDKIFAAKFNNACYLCDVISHKPSSRTWALAVEREQVVSEQGQVIGIRDKTREVLAEDANGNFIVEGKDAEGKDIYKKEIVPAFVVMNMGWKNFFAGLEGQGMYFGTILDADYLITRSGTDTSSTYSVVRVGEIMLGEGNEYGLPAGTKYDLNNRDLMRAVYPNLPDLRKLIAHRVSEDYLGYWFLPNWAPPEQPGQQQNGAPQQGQQIVMGTNVQTPGAPAPVAGATPPSGAMEALKSRVLGGGQPVEAQSAPQQ